MLGLNRKDDAMQLKDNSLLSELWHELNHWWIWLIIVLIILVGVTESMGWMPSGQRLCPWWIVRC